MIEFEGPAIRYEKPYRLTIAVIDPIFSYSKKYNNTMQYNFMDTVYSMLESDVFYYSHKKDILSLDTYPQYNRSSLHDAMDHNNLGTKR